MPACDSAESEIDEIDWVRRFIGANNTNVDTTAAAEFLVEHTKSVTAASEDSATAMDRLKTALETFDSRYSEPVCN